MPDQSILDQVIKAVVAKVAGAAWPSPATPIFGARVFESAEVLPSGQDDYPQAIVHVGEETVAPDTGRTATDYHLGLPVFIEVRLMKRTTDTLTIHELHRLVLRTIQEAFDNSFNQASVSDHGYEGRGSQLVPLDEGDDPKRFAFVLAWSMPYRQTIGDAAPL